MNFKKKPIKSKPFLLLNYIDNNDDIFVDKEKLILSYNATEIQKKILKCFEDDDYFGTLTEEEKNEIDKELTKFANK